MAGKFKENPEVRKRRLEEAVTAPENDYDDNVADSTKYNDKYREKKMQKFFLDCKEVGHMQFVNDYESYIGILSNGTHDQVDIFLAKYMTMLHNDQDPDGLYKITTLNAYVHFLKRLTYKICGRKDINFTNLRAFQRQYDKKIEELRHAGKGTYTPTPSITTFDQNRINNFFIPANYETIPEILQLKIEFDLRYLFLLRGQETMPSLKLCHFEVSTTIVDGVEMRCIKCVGVQLHRKGRSKSRVPEPPKFDALIGCPK